MLACGPEGVFVNPFERGEIGPDLFRAALLKRGMNRIAERVISVSWLLPQ